MARASKTFASSGSFTVPAGVVLLEAEGCGGGGGGGGGAGVGAAVTSNPPAGGAGGGGALQVRRAFVVTPGHTLTVSIGAGGTSGGAGASGGANPGSAGGPGGATTVADGASTLWQAAGGSGGAG
ncbi:MAG TPA: hypothetical protein VE987_14665, partial [Polyangiaceae bacterium]|nr:hypothetical protein [Polyangiaceae bacterium]